MAHNYKISAIHIFLLLFYFFKFCTSSAEIDQILDWSQPPEEPLADMSLPSLLSSSNDDGSCTVGSNIVLRRILKKLFNHVNILQPNELDDEFIYQSAISYNDYLIMSKYLKDDKLDCANLHKLDTLLSKFITNAQVLRPNEFTTIRNPIELIGNMPRILLNHVDSLFRTVQYWHDGYLIVILTCVGLTSWFLRDWVGYSKKMAFGMAFMITGFVEFYMHKRTSSILKQQEQIDRCDNPSYFSRVITYFGYDYDNCRAIYGSHARLDNSNVASILIQFLSELFLDPLVTFGRKGGQAIQQYLDAFPFWQQVSLAPLFIIIGILTSASVVIYFSKFLLGHIFTRKRSRSSSNPNHRLALIAPKRRQQQQNNHVKHNSSTTTKRIK